MWFGVLVDFGIRYLFNILLCFVCLYFGVNVDVYLDGSLVLEEKIVKGDLDLVLLMV